MKVQLLVSEWCASCHQAERVWSEVAQERDIDYQVVDMAQPEGKALVSQMRLKTIPALLIDDELKGIGVQSKAEALELVKEAPTKARSQTQHVGLGLAPSSRAYVLSAMIYLFLAGGSLVTNAGLFAEGYARPAPLHLFTVGFMSFLVFGVAEHMIPRFTGLPIRLGAWTWSQFGLAHGGLVLFFLGFVLTLPGLAVTGGVILWAALVLFAVRLWPLLLREPANGHSFGDEVRLDRNSFG